MKKSRVFALGFVVATAFAGSAFAQRAPETGFYVGGSLGQAQGNEWCSTSGAPAGTVVSNCDDKDTAWKAFVGYQVNRWLAVEGTYMDLGEYTATVTIPGFAAVNTTTDASSWNIAALASVPLGPVSLFGKLGYARTENEATVNNVRFGEDGGEAIYGVGVKWDMTRNWALRAEWERLNKSEIDLLSVGVQFRF
jgi:OOP family OmpA-OmpF porin